MSAFLIACPRVLSTKCSCFILAITELVKENEPEEIPKGYTSRFEPSN